MRLLNLEHDSHGHNHQDFEKQLLRPALSSRHPSRRIGAPRLVGMVIYYHRVAA